MIRVGMKDGFRFPQEAKRPKTTVKHSNKNEPKKTFAEFLKEAQTVVLKN
jgi:hypothetical protein